MAGQARALPDLKSRIVLDATGLHQAEKDAATATGKIKGHVGSVGVISKDTEGKIAGLGTKLKGLGPLGNAASAGLTGLSNTLGGTMGIATVALGTLGALGVGILKGVGEYASLAKSVESYMHITGQSATASGQQIQAFKELGVDGDVAAGAMVKFSKAIHDTPEKLQALGVEIAKDAKGNVDLHGTLLNVIDAWNATEDAVQRNIIVTTAFGKKGAALIPILVEGSAELRRLEAAVRVTFTESDIERAHKMELQQKQVDASFTAMRENLGSKLIPILGAVSDSYLENEYVLKRLDQAGENAIGARIRMANANDTVVKKLREEYQASAANVRRLNELTVAHEKAAQAALDQEKALTDLITTEQTALDAGLAMEHASLAQAHAQDNLKQAQLDLNDAVKQFGPKSKEAHDARLALTDAELAAREAIIHTVQAQVDQTEKTAEGTGALYDSKMKLSDQIHLLELQAGTLDPRSALYRNLETYINGLRSIPTSVTTAIQAVYHKSGEVGRASGGPVLPNRAYTVGERGPEIFVPDQPGTIIPNRGGRVPQTTGAQIVNHFHQVIASPADLAREMAWQKKVSLAR